MIPVVASHCGLFMNVGQQLVGGFVGTIGLFANMIIIGYIYRAWNNFNSTTIKEAGEKVVKDLLYKK